MKVYLNKIELTKNFRGVWELDPFKGCTNSVKNDNTGCYGICYATRIAKSRGYDFSKVVYRYFINNEHFIEIANKLKNTPFVRMGVMCDPSHDWQHTLSITDKVKPYQKNIVIVTKHLKELEDKDLIRLENLIINTSISALDTQQQRDRMLFWYNKLKDYCKRSILRVNTADFNQNELRSIQDNLLDNEDVIDNILRFTKNHKLVKEGVINVTKCKFLNSETYVSKHNAEVYFGYCDECPDQCGAILAQRKLLGWLN